jgi:hypothetical protein
MTDVRGVANFLPRVPEADLFLQDSILFWTRVQRLCVEYLYNSSGGCARARAPRVV